MTIAPHIGKLYDLLGYDAVLIEVRKGEKAPVAAGWQKLRLADTHPEDYQAALARGNVGVVLGDASNGLCAIDIDDDQDMEPFFKLNPALRDTLISRGARGVQVWVRCLPDRKFAQLDMPNYPEVKALKFAPGHRDKVSATDPDDRAPGPYGEWRANGGQSVIYGQHPSGADYTLVNESKVKEIRFRDIRWPSELDLPWKDSVNEAIKEKYGDGWTTKDDGSPQAMIEPYWAGVFAYNYEVVYEKDEERYYIYDYKRGLWERAIDNDITYKGTQMLLKASRKGAGMHVLQTTRFRSAAKMGAMSSHLKSIVGGRNIFKKRRGLIHLRNGMLDLMAVDPEDPALTLLPFSPDYYSRNQIPVTFDPEATCPTFRNDLLGRGLNPDDVKLMQRWGGLLLLQENIFQKMMILTGTAGAGKSTVISVFQKMVGQDNCAQLRTEQLLERFEMAAFIGKSTLIGADVPGSFLMQRGAYKLKQLTGGDFFQAEIKTARDLVTLKGDYNVGITCNSRLRINMDSDAGAWDRRLLIIRYEAAPPEKKIPNFDDWLIENEGPGILNWMIEGALDVLHAGKFDMTDEQKSTVTDLLEESDSIRSFMRRCVVPGSKSNDVTTDELIEAYHAFCDDRGWEAIPAGTLEKQLPNLMLELYRVNKGNNIERDGTKRRGYTRIQLIDPKDESNIYDAEEELAIDD